MELAIYWTSCKLLCARRRTAKSASLPPPLPALPIIAFHFFVKPELRNHDASLWQAAVDRWPSNPYCHGRLFPVGLPRIKAL